MRLFPVYALQFSMWRGGRSLVCSILLLAAAPRCAFSLCMPVNSPRLDEATRSGLLVVVPAQPGRRKVLLLGTVHLGDASALDCTDLIQSWRPDTVVLELSPMRLSSIRSRPANAAPSTPTPPSVTSTINLVVSLARIGWAAGGITGLGVACIMAREALQRQDERELPRVDAFAAAVAAADSVGSRIVAADLELPDLIQLLCLSMGPLSFLQLIVAELSGEAARDPIKRGHFKKEETLSDWAERRRDVSLARFVHVLSKREQERERKRESERTRVRERAREEGGGIFWKRGMHR